MTSQTWPQGGYAPGSYWCFCLTCRQKFTGDKRAYHCPDCVIQAQAAEVARLTAERDALREALEEIHEVCIPQKNESRGYGRTVRGWVEVRTRDVLNNFTKRNETAV